MCMVDYGIMDYIAKGVWVGSIILGVAVMTKRVEDRNNYLEGLSFKERLKQENKLERCLRRVAEWGSD